MEKEYIYFIRNEDNKLVKIGKTNNLNKRLKQIKRQFTHLGLIAPELTLIEYIETENSTKLEKVTHEKFKQYRAIGEWFDINELQIKQWIIDMKDIKIEKSNCINVRVSTFKEFKNSNNKETILIPYNYLSLKPSTFSFRLYFNIYNYFKHGLYNEKPSIWMQNFSFKGMSDTLKNKGFIISRNTIKNNIENNNIFNIEEIEYEKYTERFLFLNIEEPLEIDKNIFKNIDTNDEIMLRLIILFYKNDTLLINQKDLLREIGYSAGSNNYMKITECVGTLKELQLINTKEVKQKGTLYVFNRL